MMIGTLEWLRSSLHTEKPSMSGRPTSRRTRSGSAASSASRPLDDEALAAQPLREGLGDGVLVLDEQELHTSSVRETTLERFRKMP
jgi:hypothetical protein